MRDYADIVSQIRIAAIGVKKPSNRLTLMQDAADAIEELLAERDDWETIAKYKAKIIEKMESEQRDIMRQLPTWISVEERLPKKKVGDEGYNGYLVLSDGEYQIADFTHDKYMQTAYEFHVDGEYDPNVTHWMELPPQEVE